MSEEMKKRDVIGEYIPAKDGQPAQIDRDWLNQGFVFKDRKAYENDKSAVCYVPELSDTAYTGQDFLDMCNGQQEIADLVFENVDWQHPETYLDEIYDEGEIEKCSCGKWYLSYNVDKCPYCGAPKPEEE